MEIHFFVFRFLICIQGVDLKIMVPFLRFSNLALFLRSLGICFLRGLILNQSKDLNLKIKDFEVK